jgi:hypothetical protein
LKERKERGTPPLSLLSAERGEKKNEHVRSGRDERERTRERRSLLTHSAFDRFFSGF